MKNKRILNCSVKASLLKYPLREMGNQQEITEQVDADLYFNGINIDVKQLVIEELIERLHNLIPNLIVMTHN